MLYDGAVKVQRKRRFIGSQKWGNDASGPSHQ